MALEAIVAEMENEDVKAWATAELDKMDAANEARKNKVTPKKQELIDAATKLAAEYFTAAPQSWKSASNMTFSTKPAWFPAPLSVVPTISWNTNTSPPFSSTKPHRH